MEFENWARVVAKGFDFESHASTFKRYSQTEGVFVFGAYMEGGLVGGGAVAIHELIADLGMTSILSKHRGKGIQKALIKSRLNFAKSQGCKLAALITEPGSISDNNAKKLGFQTAYLRFKLEKKLLDD